MENASKAIIFAGGVLIAILIISVCMYMYTSFRDLYASSMQMHDTAQVEAFNSFFYNFPSEIKGYEVYNILGKINDVNANSDRLTSITFDSETISSGDYKTTTFYFTEVFNSDFTYEYKDSNSDGIIDYVEINEKEVG